MEVRTVLCHLVLILFLNTFKPTVSDDVCGKVSNVQPVQTRIIKGYDVGYYKYPWFGVLKKNNVTACGATLISSQYALSAANCFREYFSPKPNVTLKNVYTLVLGAYNICDTSEATQKSFEVATVYINEGFSKGLRYNNIALLKLGSEAKGFQPVCVPSKAIAPEDRPREGIITGVGVINNDPITRTCTVHEGRVLISSEDQCNETLQSLHENATAVLSKAFCANGAKGNGPYGCRIDLGGPLIILDENARYFLLGIITFRKCAAKDGIALFTDVSQYLDWISEKISGSNTTEAPTTTTDDDYDYPDEKTTVAATSTQKPTEATTSKPGDTTHFVVVVIGKRHQNQESDQNHHSGGKKKQKIVEHGNRNHH